MLLEIKLKYYNSTAKIGFNTWREIYDCKDQRWIKADYHLGRIVYGKERISYTKIKSGIDVNNFIAQQYCPF